MQQRYSSSQDLFKENSLINCTRNPNLHQELYE